MGSFSKFWFVRRFDLKILSLNFLPHKNDDLMTHSSMMSAQFLILPMMNKLFISRKKTRRINGLLKDWFAQIGLRLIGLQIEFVVLIE